MEKRLRRRLAELGWSGPIEEACINIAWLYLVGAFDPAVLRPFMDEDGSPRTGECEYGAFDPVWASVLAMLDEAERVGRSDDLAPPSINTPEQVVRMLGRRFGQV